MAFGRNLIYVVFLALLLGTMILSHSNRAIAEDYAALPASAELTTPLKSGDRAPKFTVRTVDDKPYVFDPDNLENPTILISFRGGWCPYCNMHLSELRTVIPEIRESGYDVLFLSNDRPELLYSSLKQETQDDIDGLDYVILSDADMNAAMALGTAFRIDKGLTDYLEQKGRDVAGSSIGMHNALAVPAVYVINKSGDIVFDFVNADYKIRLPADEFLSVAKASL
ncbi:MAG: redoxin domain-containing protein [Proteobacteria bacterium]|nr:redoxin domain-containing protein [Pseudomonadota bacterium]